MWIIYGGRAVDIGKENTTQKKNLRNLERSVQGDCAGDNAGGELGRGKRESYGLI